VAYLYARGGRFEDHSAAFGEGKKLGHAWSRALCVYNPQVGTTINSQTGERLSGTPCFQAPRFADGTPMRDIDLGFADPTREVAGTWLEGVSGASVSALLRGENYSSVTAPVLAELTSRAYLASTPLV